MAIRNGRAAAVAAVFLALIGACGEPRRPSATRASVPVAAITPSAPGPTWPPLVRPTACSGPHCLGAQVRLPAKALAPSAAKRAVAARAREVLAVLAAGDVARLAPLVHPEHGLRLSTETYVLESDVLLSRDEVGAAVAADAVRTWGHTDGKGEPIRATLKGILHGYFYDRDYARAPEVAYNRVIHAGNTIVNVLDVYPRATLVEYHFCVPPGELTLDWRSLRLLFEPHGGEFFLVALVRDHWTI